MGLTTAAAVDRLLRGRLDHEPTAPLTEDKPELTLTEAYAIQRDVERALVSRGGRIVGWKVGFTTSSLQEAYRVSEPVLAFLLDSGLLNSGGTVPTSRCDGLALAGDVALLMNAALS